MANPNKLFCLTLKNKDRVLDQRVTLAECDENDELQQFDYTNARLYSRANSRLCGNFKWAQFAKGIGGRQGMSAFEFSNCYPNVWEIENFSP